MSKTQRLKEMRTYLDIKYRGAYDAAIMTLYSQLFREAWDKNGYLKAEYMLTDEQKDALKFYVPEVMQVMSDYTRRKQL